MLLTKVFSVFLFAGVLLCGCATPQTPVIVSRPKSDKITLESVVKEILSLPEEQINLGEYALSMTKAALPEINMDADLEEINQMADAIRPRLVGVKEPREIVGILNKYFFEEMGFSGWEFHKEKNDNPDYILLHATLRRRMGQCLPIGILYLSLAERLNLPILGVIIPDHFFVRYDDGYNRINIDTTIKPGENMSDDELLQKCAPLVTKKDAEIRKRFLRNATKKEILANYVTYIINDEFYKQKEKNEIETAIGQIDFPALISQTDYIIQLSPDNYLGYAKKGGLFDLYGLYEIDKQINCSTLAQAKENLQVAYDLYPYDMDAIEELAAIHYDLDEYESALQKINELFQKFSEQEIKKTSKISAKTLREMKEYCEENLMDKKSTPAPDKNTLPKPASQSDK